MSDTREERTEQYVSAESLLPFGALLESIRGTDKAVHVGYYSEDKPGRDHHWIAHMPDYERGSEEFLSVRISTGIGGVSYVDLETASDYLQPQQFYSWKMVVKAVVDVEKTPIPYKREDTVLVECPECDRGGTTHPWKFDDYVPDVCPCGYEGEWNVY